MYSNKMVQSENTPLPTIHCSKTFPLHIRQCVNMYCRGHNRCPLAQSTWSMHKVGVLRGCNQIKIHMVSWTGQSQSCIKLPVSLSSPLWCYKPCKTPRLNVAWGVFKVGTFRGLKRLKCLKTPRKLNVNSSTIIAIFNYLCELCNYWKVTSLPNYLPATCPWKW